MKNTKNHPWRFNDELTTYGKILARKHLQELASTPEMRNFRNAMADISAKKKRDEATRKKFLAYRKKVATSY